MSLLSRIVFLPQEGVALRKLLLLVVISLTAACTYGANPTHIRLPASELGVDRVIDQAVSVFVEPDIEHLTVQAGEGHVCSAHSFPVSAGPAIIGGIQNAIEESFANYDFRKTHSYTGDGLDLKFSLETFRIRLSINPATWDGVSIATAELILRVDIGGVGNPPQHHTTISGEGSGQVKGGCDAGASASAEAAEHAIRHTMKDFVHKIVNSGDFLKAD